MFQATAEKKTKKIYMRFIAANAQCKNQIPKIREVMRKKKWDSRLLLLLFMFLNERREREIKCRKLQYF